MSFAIEKHGQGYTVREADTVLPYILCAASTLDEALAFIRSRMEPEGEGEKPLDKLQRLGQECDARVDGAKHLVVRKGAWYRRRDGKVFGPAGAYAYQKHTFRVGPHDYGPDGKSTLCPTDYDCSGLDLVEEVPEPTPPRHGDFGSRPEEDGA